MLLGWRGSNPRYSGCKPDVLNHQTTPQFCTSEKIRTLIISFGEKHATIAPQTYFAWVGGLEPYACTPFSSLGEKCLTVRRYPYIIDIEGFKPSDDATHQLAVSILMTICGEYRIRTYGTVARTFGFQPNPIDHSSNSPVVAL